jgi:2'-5' RNA ligase
MRLFFGVGLPGRVRKEVSGFCASIKEKLPRMKWVEEENLHVTLKFLGEVEKEKLNALFHITEEATSDFNSFSASLGDLGAFPNPKRARVFWLGLKKGEKECMELFEKLEARLAKNKFPREEKSFHPHITLARLKFPESLQLEELSPPTDLIFFAESVTLYESVLTPKGPIYTIIKEFLLGKEAN